MAEYQTNFARLPEPAYMKDHEEVFEYVEALRQITASGAEMVAFDHAALQRRYATYVRNRWHLFERGDRGGFKGFFEKDPNGIAREICRPIEAVAKNLMEAQQAAAKFSPVFYRWMDPIINPGRRHDADDFGDHFPSSGRGF